jgi:glyoxylase-like metal-dependent hydrolase (beta-lactamase superfamily II)
MRRGLWLAGMSMAMAGAFAWSMTASAAEDGLEHAALRLGVAGIASLEYQAHGRYYQFSQAPSPELPWPPFDVRDYVATLDFARGAVHARYHRVQVQEPGRARPHSEATMDQYFVDGVTWNLGPGPTAMPANLAERQAELWASPQGFIKAAMTHQARVGSRNGSVTVSFRIGAYLYEGDLNPLGEVLAVRAAMPSAVLGDTPIEFRYSGYRDFDGVWFPSRIERRAGGFPWYELDVTAVRANTAAAFAIPPVVVANPAPVANQVVVTELAPGVFNFGGASHNSVVVEQAHGLVVIEAPLDEARSLAVLAAIERSFPGQPVRYVINTHAHFDHAGGLRTYVARGATVVTHVRNAKYYRLAWQAPRTLEPDELARTARAPRFRTFTDRLVLADAQRPVELHTITGSGHNDAFAMAWLPKQKLLVEGDAWTPTPPGVKPPAVVNPLWLNLRDNIQRLGLDVERIQPLHGALQTREDFARALRGP